MIFLIRVHKSSLKNKTILRDVDIEFSKNCHLKTHDFLSFSVHIKKQVIFLYAVSPRNFISIAAFGAWAEPPFFRNSAAISSKDFPLVSGTLKNVNRVKAKTTPAKRKNT